MIADFSNLKRCVIKSIPRLFFLAAWTVFLVSDSRADPSLTPRQWKIGGVMRQALIHVPASARTTPTPVVFAFHGHGGNMRRVARVWDYQEVWPQAVIVYMQGLRTPGRLTDRDGRRTGWQRAIGDQEDRDLKFFDAVLASLEQDYQVDKDRIYATGHSNGGSFTYLLWQARPKVFAAFAPSAAVYRPLVAAHDGFVPKPVMVIAGEKDTLVKFSWQRRMIAVLRERNQCAAGQPWDVDKRCVLYSSRVKAPVMAYIHPGGHKFPADARALIVQFFKEHSRSG